MQFSVKVCKLGHVTLKQPLFSKKKLKQSKKLIPYMSLDERVNICARALLNNLLKVEINGILF